jgi:hypothetical protein
MGPLYPRRVQRLSRGAFFFFQNRAQESKRGESAHQCQTLDEERPEAKEAPHDEAGQYAFNLRDARTGGVFSQRADEVGGDE